VLCYELTKLLTELTGSQAAVSQALRYMSGEQHL